MRSPVAVIAISAVVGLSACDDTPLPQRIVAPSKPSSLFLLQPQWTVTQLPFQPKAINDAGVVVGYMNGEAVRWENDSVKLLRHGYPSVPQNAVAISQLGRILGWGQGNVLDWATADATPISYSTCAPLTPVAIDDDDAFIMNTPNTTCPSSALLRTKWQWTPLGPITPGFRYPTVTAMNRYGYFTGRTAGKVDSYAVRWDPSGVPTVLSTLGGRASGEAINSRGDVLGWSGAGATIWGIDNSTRTLAGFPAGSKIAGWNDAGRVVGNEASGGRAFTYLNGTVTYLPLLEPGNPTITGVNSCGWIVGIGAGNYGFLWKRTGATVGSACDNASPPEATM